MITRQRRSGGFEKGWHDVDVGGDAIVAGASFELSWPAHEEGGADAAVVYFVFLAAGRADVATRIGAVVDHEDDDGVFGCLAFVEVGEKLADVLVDVLHHGENASDGVGIFVIAEQYRRKILVLIFSIQGFGHVVVGAVRGIGRDVGEEGFLGFERLVDEIEGSVEVDVGAVAFGLNLLIVAEEKSVGVAPFVFTWLGWLTQAAAEVDEGFLKTLVGWTHWVVVAEVPFAEDASRVPCVA